MELKLVSGLDSHTKKNEICLVELQIFNINDGSEEKNNAKKMNNYDGGGHQRNRGNMKVV